MNAFAMAFDSATRAFAKRSLTKPQLVHGEVLIQVTCCTICGSDLHTFTGRRSAPAGCILGHEIVGRVVAWGGDSAPLDYHQNPLVMGQRVTWAMAVGCGQCYYCRNGLSQKCETLFKYGHESGRQTKPSGGLAQHCVLVPGTPIFSIPDALSDEVASPANCATSTVSAAMRLVQQTHSIVGKTVMVTGAGMLGLTAAAQLSELGAKDVVIVDPNRQRLARASLFGATSTNSGDCLDSLMEHIMSLSDRRGADISLDFAGVTSAVEVCFAATRVGGCILLAGSVFPSSEISLSPEQLVRRMVTLRGLHNYLPEDLDHALKFLDASHQKYPFQDLVTPCFSLTQTQQAFEYARDHSPVRVAVKPE